MDHFLRAHNGLTIDAYPESDGWFWVPFPKSKGEPFVQDNLATVSSSSFRNLAWFKKIRDVAYLRWGGLDQSPSLRLIDWRLYIFLSLARAARSKMKGNHTESHPQFFVELGVGQGLCSTALLEDVRLNYRLQGDFRLFNSYWLFDTFTKSSNEQFSYAANPFEVISHFKHYRDTTIVQGMLPETLISSGLISKLSDEKGRSGRIAFCHVDLNSAAAEEASMSLLAPYLTRAVILFDDSTNWGCEDQLQLHREIAKDLNRTLVELPTGQAFIL